MEPFVIGIFDSGLGGLTVVKEIKKLLPKVNLIYLGDTARIPYGTRSKETIKKFAKEDTLFLLSKKVDLIVVACNTVSSIAIDVVRKNSNVPVFEVIKPAIERAKVVTKNNKIGVVGTRATISSNAYSEASLRAHASMIVPLVEEGFIKGPEINLFIDKYFKVFKGKVDTLILGCTHYPLIKNEIKKYLGKKINLVDPASEVARAVSKYTLKLNKEVSNSSNRNIYYLTDVNDRFKKTAKLFLGENIENKIRKVEL